MFVDLFFRFVRWLLFSRFVCDVREDFFGVEEVINARLSHVPGCAHFSTCLVIEQEVVSIKVGRFRLSASRGEELEPTLEFVF